MADRKKEPHAGHRSRLRERFRLEGLESFADHEVLELLLFYGKSRGDTNAIAHALLDSFGSLKAVLEARPEQLETVPGVGPECACLLSMTVPLFRRYMASVAAEQKRIRSRVQAEDYCKALLSGLRTERFYTICLNAQGRVIGRRLIAEGTLEEVNAYPRLVVETVLNYTASAVIFCHNHPGGTREPSQADITVTGKLEKLLGALGVTVMDHIVVADGSAWSMAQHGQIIKG